MISIGVEGLTGADRGLVELVVCRLRENGDGAYCLRARVLQALIEAAQLDRDHHEARALKRQLEQLVLAGGRDIKPDNTNREGR